MRILISLVFGLGSIGFAAPLHVDCKTDWGTRLAVTLREDGNRVRLRIESAEKGLSLPRFLEGLGVASPTAKVMTAEFHRDDCQSLAEMRFVHTCRGGAIRLTVEGSEVETHLLYSLAVEFKDVRSRSVSVNDERVNISVSGYRKVDGSFRHSMVEEDFWKDTPEFTSCVVH